MLAVTVYLNNKEIDTVFYNDDIINGFSNIEELRDYIKKSLVDHDGYNPNIKCLFAR